MQICHPITLATAAALLVGSAVAHAAEPLPALGVDITQTSVSGISSGAYMAGQFHLAFSTTVVGAGVVAGGPWGCASNGSGDSLLLGGLDNATRALAGCMQVTGGAPDGGALAEAAKAFAHKHRIDPLSGLEGDRVYLFHGESDSVVATPVTTAAEAFYRSAGITVADMHAVYQLPGGKAGHSLVVDRDGSACDANASPFIDDCDYDQAGEILRWIYPDLVGRPGPASGPQDRVRPDRVPGRCRRLGHRARGRRLCPGRLRGRTGLPRAHRVPRLSAEPDHRRHRRPVHRAHRVHALRRRQPDRAALPADQRQHGAELVLGLVGACVVGPPVAERAAAGRGAGDARSAGGAARG